MQRHSQRKHNVSLGEVGLQLCRRAASEALAAAAFARTALRTVDGPLRIGEWWLQLSTCRTAHLRRRLEEAHELESRLEEPLLRREEVLMAAKMRAMAVETDHDVLVLYDLLDRYAIPIDDRVILDEVDERWHRHIHNVGGTRAVFVIGLAVLLLHQFPVDLLLEFHDPFEFVHELLSINVDFLVDRCEDVKILAYHLPISIASTTVKEAIPGAFDVVSCTGEDEWWLDAGCGDQFVLELLAATAQCQCKQIAAKREAHGVHFPVSAPAIVVMNMHHRFHGVLPESAANRLLVREFEP